MTMVSRAFLLLLNRCRQCGGELFSMYHYGWSDEYVRAHRYTR